MLTSSIWQQVGSQWERPLTSMETFYTVLSSNIADGEPAHWVVSSALKFAYAGSDTEVALSSRLRKAWVQVRYHFPMLAARISAGKKVYVPLGGEEAESWLEQTFHVHESGTLDEVFGKGVKAPLITLHFFPQTQHLLLQAAHDLIDGRGCLYIWDAFFTALASPQDFPHGNEVRNLPPSEDHLLDVPAEPTESMREDVAGLVRLFDVEEPIRMPVSASHSPGPSFRRELRLSAEMSGAVVHACKVAGLTVTSAWHAAMILATHKIQGNAAGHSAGKTNFSISNFDLRNHFPADFEPKKNPVGVYHTAFPFRVEQPAERGFEDIAKEIHHKYKTTLDAGRARIMSAWVAAVLELFANVSAPGSTPVQSSIGIVDRFVEHSYGTDWAVEDLWVADSMLTPEIEAFLWSWKGQIVLSGSCNSSFYTQGDLDDFLGHVRDELLKGLRIE